MSTTNKIQKMFWSLLEDSETHTIKELTNLALSQQIITEDQAALVRGAVSLMRKSNPEIEMVERGKYRLNKLDGPCITSSQNMNRNEQSEYVQYGKSAYLAVDKKKEDLIIAESDIFQAIDTLKKRLTQIKTISWLTVPEDMIREARRDYSLMLDLSKEIRESNVW